MVGQEIRINCISYNVGHLSGGGVLSHYPLLTAIIFPIGSQTLEICIINFKCSPYENNFTHKRNLLGRL